MPFEQGSQPLQPGGRAPQGLLGRAQGHAVGLLALLPCQRPAGACSLTRIDAGQGNRRHPRTLPRWSIQSSRGGGDWINLKLPTKNRSQLIEKYQLAIFNPTNPPTIASTLTTLRTLRLSPWNTAPAITAPTAPMPTQVA